MEDKKDEEKESEEGEKVQPPKDNTDEGVQSKAVTDLDRADEIVERRNRVCEREEKILARKEALAAREAVGGIADAGAPAEKKPEMTDKEYAEAAKRGDLNLKDGEKDKA